MEERKVTFQEAGVLGEFPYCIIHIRFDYGDWPLDPILNWMNGYLGVPPSHPWYGKEYDNIEAECHGGLTYSGELVDKAVYAHQQPWQNMDIWWVGFDTAHAFDHDLKTGKWNLNLDYVRNECQLLARQAVEALHATV